jgi:adenylylsulfate kinase
MRNNGIVIWMTDLSGSGKSTIANHLKNILLDRSINVEVLDGDEIRQHLSPGLGYTKQDRDRHIRRLGFIANLLSRHGVIVIVAAISPYRSIRAEVRSMVSSEFLEVYINCPIEVCEQRDVKGLYQAAKAGEIKNFTGIDAPYEHPLDPEITCYTDRESGSESTFKILAALANRGLLEPIEN